MSRRVVAAQPVKQRGFYSEKKLLGPRCPYCRGRVPKGLGTRVHPTCGPDVAWMLKRERDWLAENPDR